LLKQGAVGQIVLYVVNINPKQYTVRGVKSGVKVDVGYSVGLPVVENA